MIEELNRQDIYAEDEWYIYMWPDGTWAEKDEIHLYRHRSDDYCLHRVITHDEHYNPLKTVPVKVKI